MGSRLIWVVLVLGCSAHVEEPVEEPTPAGTGGAPAEHRDTTVRDHGEPWPYDTPCTPGCPLLYPDRSSGGWPAPSGESSDWPCGNFWTRDLCEAATPGWIYDVPACGESSYFIYSCRWNVPTNPGIGTAHCQLGAWGVQQQACRL